MGRYFGLIFGLCLWALNAAAGASVFTYEGYLTDTSGVPVTAGSLPSLFRIYGDPGTPGNSSDDCLLLSETPSLSVNAGFFKVQIGSTLTAAQFQTIFSSQSSIPGSSCTFNATITGARRYLAVEVNSVALGSIAFSTSPTAAVADNADKLGGVTAANYIQVSQLAGLLPAETDPTAKGFAKQDVGNLTSGSCGAGQVVTFDGTKLTCVNDATGAGGLTSLNGLGVSTQSFANGSTGTAPSWNSTGSTHTLNIPMANTSSVTAGLLSKSQYDAFDAKLGAVSGEALLANGKIWIGDSGGKAAEASGSATGQSLRWNGGAWVASKLNYTDLINASSATPWPTVSCTAIQSISWSSVSDSFYCQDVARVGTSTASDFRIQTNGTDRVFVSSSGQVGIGTTPTSLLHVDESFSGAARPTFSMRQNYAGQAEGASSFSFGASVDMTNTYNQSSYSGPQVNGTKSVGLAVSSHAQIPSGKTNAYGAHVGLNSETTRNANSGYTDSGTFASLIGGRFSVRHDNQNVSATPVTSSATGVTIEGQFDSGTVNSYVGLRISTPQVNGTASLPTTPIGVYQEGSTMQNIFEGSIAVGPSGNRTVLLPPSSGASVLRLPTGTGTNGYALTTDGAGNTSWSQLSAGALTGSFSLSGGTSQIQASSLTTVPFVLKGAVGQTSDLQQWQNSAGTVLYSVNASGTPTASTDLTTKAYVDGKVSKSGDTMTGVLNLPANGLVAGGSQFVLANSTVGIGTTNPDNTYAFDVIASGAGQRIRRYGGIPSLHLSRANGSEGAPAAISSTDSVGRISLGGYDGTATYGEGARIEAFAAESYAASVHGTDLVFSTTKIGGGAPQEKMRLTSSGFLGIGATSPNSTLQVQRTTATTATMVESTAKTIMTLSPLASSTTDYRATYSQATTGTAQNMQSAAGVWGEANQVQSSTITNMNGVVGVASAASGTITNATGLSGSVNASGGGISNAYAVYASGSLSSGTISNLYGIYVASMTAGTNNYGVYVNGNSVPSYFAGNVGIGTTNPSFGKLQVEGGNIYLDTNADGNGGYITEAGLNGIGLVGAGVRLATPDLYVTDGGNVGIGTTTPGNKLTVLDSAGGAAALIEGIGAVVPSLIAKNANSGPQVRFDNGVGYVDVRAPAAAATNFVFPSTNGTDGQVLTAKGGGATAWQNPRISSAANMVLWDDFASGVTGTVAGTYRAGELAIWTTSGATTTGAYGTPSAAAASTFSIVTGATTSVLSFVGFCGSTATSGTPAWNHRFDLGQTLIYEARFRVNSTAAATGYTRFGLMDSNTNIAGGPKGIYFELVPGSTNLTAYTKGTGSAVNIGTFAISIATYYNLQIVYTGGAVSYYVNGSQVGSNYATAADIPTATAVCSGATNYSGTTTKTIDIDYLGYQQSFTR